MKLITTIRVTCTNVLEKNLRGEGKGFRSHVPCSQVHVNFSFLQPKVGDNVFFLLLCLQTHQVVTVQVHVFWSKFSRKRVYWIGIMKSFYFCLAVNTLTMIVGQVQPSTGLHQSERRFSSLTISCADGLYDITKLHLKNVFTHV